MWQQGCCHSVIISTKFTKITLESLVNLKFLFACHLLMGWVSGGVAGDTPAEGVAENACRRLEPGGDFPLLNENLSEIYKPFFD